ncbi:MAG: response regulator transcription factor [Bacteroidales bacterium]|jgi:DNA-binding NarL/FixJ family response regulator|nr:response regulator transcription factor [Bacteroidales bacterium]MBO7322759.1 response regulator transcription factor [Bacteroidales bacterium]MBQ5882852.1 response regulator transcription factor [Bacteroidales bacterium]
MTTNEKKKIILITPSKIIARGINAILSDYGDFRLEAILSDISRENENVLKNTSVDIIIIDTGLWGYSSRRQFRSLISEYSDAAIIGVNTLALDEESKKLYDELFSIYDAPSVIINKLRAANTSEREQSEQNKNELSIREQEILVCVAKGMLNKEIADKFNISIHTVITHRKNITKKTGIKTVAGLTVYALLNNLIDPNSIE